MYLELLFFVFQSFSQAIKKTLHSSSSGGFNLPWHKAAGKPSAGAGGQQPPPPPPRMYFCSSSCIQISFLSLDIFHLLLTCKTDFLASCSFSAPPSHPLAPSSPDPDSSSASSAYSPSTLRSEVRLQGTRLGSDVFAYKIIGHETQVVSVELAPSEGASQIQLEKKKIFISMMMINQNYFFFFFSSHNIFFSTHSMQLFERLRALSSQCPRVLRWRRKLMDLECDLYMAFFISISQYKHPIHYYLFASSRKLSRVQLRANRSSSLISGIHLRLKLEQLCLDPHIQARYYHSYCPNITANSYAVVFADCIFVFFATPF